MADTGRTFWADGFWADDFWAAAFWAADEPVEVPDVVGDLQADGSTELEGAGFVVAVATAYSSVVAAGLIISQDPAGGAFALPGTTVTITVSLGEAAQSATGGWWPEFDRTRYLREKRRREIEEAEEAAKLIQDELDRQIYLAQRKLEAEEAERADLERLQKLADQYAGKKLDELPKVARVAILNAQDARTRNSLEQMRRVIEQAEEQEILAVQQIVLLMLDS
jgi:hypothetical protein